MSGAKDPLSGFFVHLLRSSSNDRVEVSKSRNVSWVVIIGENHPRGYPSARNAQRDEGSELRSETMPDAVPTSGRDTRLLIPGIRHGYGEGEENAVGDGQPARDELEQCEGSSMPQDKWFNTGQWPEDKIAQGE